MRGDHLIELVDVGMRRGGHIALEGFSGTFRSGERVALIGPNGAGKTTLLKMMGGLIEPTSGAVRWLGTPRPRIAFVWQGLHLVQRLSVLENTLIGALARCPSPATWLRKFPAAEIERARFALDRVDALHLAQERADRLSGGERQRVAIARALMQDAEVLLADEPTASLDWGSARGVAALLSDLAVRDGLTLVTVVHDVALLDRLSDRVIGLTGGRMAFDAAADSLRQADLETLLGPTARAEGNSGTLRRG